MDISKEDFEAYEGAYRNGLAEMFNISTVKEVTGLSREKIVEIVTHYGEYRTKFYDLKPHATSVEGAGLQLRVTVDYDIIVEEFGEPQKPPFIDNKSDAFWIIETPTGIATIYNYKDGKAYCGEIGLDVPDIKDWHLGGRKRSSCEYVAFRLYYRCGLRMREEFIQSKA